MMATWKNNQFSNWKIGEDFIAWAADRDLVISPESEPEFVWVDIETTGLDPKFDVILELGIVLTDAIGRVIKNGAITWPVFNSEPHTVFKKNWSTPIAEMDILVRNMHTGSGLLAQLEDNMLKPNIDSMNATIVQWDAVQWLRTFLPQDRKLQLSGSSPHFDRGFLREDLPVLEDWFHYRTGVDVSGIREIAKRVNPKVIEMQPEPSKVHRPLPDLADSIHLYRHLLRHFLVMDDKTQEIF